MTAMGGGAERVGWLGVGRMGAAMAGRLLAAGHPLAVWNRTTSKAEPLVRQGAEVVGTIAELANRDIVFVMVSGPADLAEVVAGPSGLLAAASPPAVIVDCSTVSIEGSALVRARAADVGVEFLAAPVSGNPHVVAEGRACIVASGPPGVFARVKPYLEAIASTVVHVGDQEQSRLVKLCHNLYLGVLTQALVEVITLAEKGGTSRGAFLEFLNGTVLGSDWTRKRAPDLVNRDWKPTFTTELLRKDLDLGLAAARMLEVPMPTVAATHQLIQAAIANGYRNDDFLALYEQQAHIAGLPEAPSERE